MRAPILAGILFSTLLAATVSGAPLQERLQSCDRVVALQAARESLRDPASLREPLSMFEPARVLFVYGEKEDALFWFYAAQLRASYQLVFEQGDRGQLLQTMLMTVGADINNYGFTDVSRLRSTLDRVLAWDKATENSLRARPQTAQQREQVAQIYSGLSDLQKKLLAEGPKLQEQAKRSEPGMQTMLAQQQAERCRAGQLSPATVEQNIHSERDKVVAFVRSHPKVIADVGKVDQVSVDSGTTQRGEQMPSHYSVYVIGSKTTFAEVDVTRSATGAAMALRCTNAVSPGNRHSRDPCAP